MIELTLGQIAATVDGRLASPADADLTVHGAVEFDSRAVGSGGLFVALPGERVDGHDFVAAAIAAGAAGALVAHPVGTLPCVVVPDVQHALGRLATEVLRRLPGVSVVGVTGSSGKTSTKDLLATLLAGHRPTVAPPGSFNNEIGHPHTVLRADESTRFLVLECSARDTGHIRDLCRIAPPAVGVVLNVGTAHLGEFGSRGAIATSKAELVEALPPSGLAVLNADDPVVLAMAGRTRARVRTVGSAPPADLWSEDVRLDPAGRASYTLVCPQGRARIELGLHGRHHVGNSLAAAAVALELGMTLDDVAAGLAAARPASRWRMEVTDRPDGVRVVNDAYNANPESMAAALHALAAMSGRGRTWAVLGEMGELGPGARAAHEGVGRLAGELGVDRLLLVGGGTALAGMAVGATRAGSPTTVDAVPDIDSAVDRLIASVSPGDVVLVKASRAVGLERLAAALLAADPTPVGVPSAAGVAR